MVTPASYEDLRKQARKLENEIDVKLTLFCKACAGKINAHKGDSSTVPLLDEERSRNVQDSAIEIEELLKKLEYLNEQMCDIKGDALLFTQHTLQRHREILADYTSEFNKTMENYQSRKNNEELLRSVRTDMSKAATSSGLNRRMDLYLKENEHIRSSSRLVDDQISIAVETREELMSQRLSMKKIQSRFNDVSNRLPLVNSLTYRINLRRRRDSFILGLIVFFCTMLILSSIFH